MRIEIIRITDGFGKIKTIGRRVDDTFYSTRTQSQHLFRKENAWSIDKEVIDREDIQNYVLLDVDTNIEYYASRTTLLKHGIPINYAGHGDQLALPLHKWEQYEVIT